MGLFSNGHQNIPPLFMEIMEVQTDMEDLMNRDVINLETYKYLDERMGDLRRAAEKALRWNTDKGNTA